MWTIENPESDILKKFCQQFNVQVDQGQADHFAKLMRLQRSLTDLEIFYKILTDEQREIVDDWFVS